MPIKILMTLRLKEAALAKQQHSKKVTSATQQPVSNTYELMDCRQ
jgi:hypothetical protein